MHDGQVAVLGKYLLSAGVSVGASVGCTGPRRDRYGLRGRGVFLWGEGLQNEDDSAEGDQNSYCDHGHNSQRKYKSTQ